MKKYSTVLSLFLFAACSGQKNPDSTAASVDAEPKKNMAKSLSCDEKIKKSVLSLAEINGGNEYAKSIEVNTPVYKSNATSASSESVKVFEVQTDYMGGTGISKVAVTQDCTVVSVENTYSE